MFFQFGWNIIKICSVKGLWKESLKISYSKFKRSPPTWVQKDVLMIERHSVKSVVNWAHNTPHCTKKTFKPAFKVCVFHDQLAGWPSKCLVLLGQGEVALDGVFVMIV